jgi:flagellar biosynthesis protein FlhF
MSLRTYRARSLQEALQLVREDLGPDASVLHTREVSAGLLRFLGGGKQIEVTASVDVQVASRFAPALEAVEYPRPAVEVSYEDSSAGRIPPADSLDFRAKFRSDLKHLEAYAPAALEQSLDSPPMANNALAAEAARLALQLASAGIPDSIVRDWLRELARQEREEAGDNHAAANPAAWDRKLARLVEAEVSIAGPIRVSQGQRRLVALVGPTGVGKTTTIAKLAANFRLSERRRVGLITVDTYRIAAVDQLRTYADIMDLPMEVVATPREMHDAVARFADFDLVLMDTAGRSPRDEVRIQELRVLLGEAQADEVHLVLSTAAGLESLQAAVNSFARVGATSLVLTKLDEAVQLGGLLPLLRDCRLPLSYTTDGQTVPDDIRPADRRRLASLMLGQPGFRGGSSGAGVSPAIR